MRLQLAVLVFALAFLSTPRVSADDDWPQFRGAGGIGVATGNPPTQWDVETGKNIKWKVKVKGLGHSSPVVHGNRVFLTTAVSDSTEESKLETGWLGGSGEGVEESGTWKWQIVCYDLESGKQLWEKTLAEGVPKTKRHLKATHANCSAATDGKHVIAFFGSEGLYCLDFTGKLIWKKDLGKLHSGPYNSKDLEWGFASSPVIYDGKVIVQCDCINTKFIGVFNIDDGKETLRIPRKDVATWSSPAIIKTKERTQIVCNGYKQMAGYDFQTGKELWTINGGGDVPVPTPFISGGLIYLTNGHGRSPVYAISPDATGDLTPDPKSETLPKGLVWWNQRGGSYMPTPIVIDDLFYNCSDNGVIIVSDAKTGERVYRERAGKGAGTFSASPVATKDHIYCCSEKGYVQVLQTGRDFELLESNKMGEIIMATPAITGDQILIRTSKNLYCIAKPKN